MLLWDNDHHQPRHSFTWCRPHGHRGDTSVRATLQPSGGESSKVGSTETEGSEESALDRDELFHLLKSQRRRRALRYLLHADETETVIMRDLAEAVAAEEYHTTVSALDSGDRQRVYITLYQSHLPQMADAGIITYDQSHGHITPTSLIQEFEPYLHRDSPEDETGVETWLWIAFGGVGLGVVTTLASLEVFGVFATIGVIIAVMAILLAIGISKIL